MTSHSFEQRISKISTNWDELVAAHESGYSTEAAKARGDIFSRYAECAFRYLLGATRNEHIASDLTQEFALRFVRGDYGKASPDRGRFRDYLKASLRNLANDHFRKQSSDAVSVEGFSRISEDSYSIEPEFSQQWRQQVLNHAWESLRVYEVSRGNLYHTVLRMRATNPDASSQELAEQFSQSSGKQVTSDWIRQTLTRSRRKFGEFIRSEVASTIESDNSVDIDDELIQLGLQKYV